MALSDKQRQIMHFPYTNYDALICDGSVRSGKTSIMSLSFFLWAMGGFHNCAFAFCGKSVGAVERNIVTPLLSIVYLRKNFDIRYNRGDHVLIAKRGNKENRFYLFGGKDESSAALIQGITLAGVMLDEVALMPRSFVEQALARCSVKGAKLWFNCNPEGPEHWFRKEWILKPEKHNALHLHFTMDDNPSLDEVTKARYRAMFSGVFFQRFVEGRWVMSEGLIYDMFDPDKNTYTDGQAPPSLHFSGIRTIACDYGTTNPTVFLDIYDYDGTIYVDREYRWDSREEHRQKTDEEYADDMEAFVGKDQCAIIVDPSAASFIAALRRRGLYVIPADNEVLDGIRRTATLFQQRRLIVNKTCRGVLNEAGIYLWDEKASMHGEDKPLKENDHCLTGDTVVETTDGPREIKDLIGESGALYCTDGSGKTKRPFHSVRMTSERKEVFEVSLLDGKKVKATQDHPILTKRGWVQLKDLRTDDEVACIGGF